MRYISRSGPVMTEATHRVTTFEIFFDLVFIFALTQIITFMGRPPTFLSLARGLILLLLFWMSWTTYTWLGNHSRADVGLIRLGTTGAMAAIFVAALVTPSAWRDNGGTVDAALTLALAYVVIRVLDLVLYLRAAVGDRQLRTTLRIFTITTVLSWIPLILGAELAGTAQTLLWAAAVAIDFSGGFLASNFSGWQLNSPSHFAERHGLVLIIAIGEALISAGTGVGTAVTRAPVLIAALLGFIVAVCLWWLYFPNAAPAAGQALATVPHARRGRTGSNAYSLTHFPLLAGIIYLALGIEQVLVHLADDRSRSAVGQPLDWPSVIALYGGLIIHLAGRLGFLRLATRFALVPQLVAIGTALALLPVARFVPVLVALGLLAALLVAFVCYERLAVGVVSRTDAGSDVDVAGADAG